MEAMNVQMGNLGKQLEITQEGVDEVRKKQVEVVPTQPTPVGPKDPGPSANMTRQSGMPRLTNNGQPILTSPVSGALESSQTFVTAPNSPSQNHEHYVKMPKHDFPKFRCLMSPGHQPPFVVGPL
jgi:hypothetical protein